MSSLRIPVTPLDHHKGDLNAPVCMVEYGDFQCPYCSVTAPVVENLLEEFRGDLCFVFRHFPLRNIHPYAELAALAAEAADQQGHFWDMYALLFKNSASLSSENIGLYAQVLKLDQDRFVYDVQRQDLIDRVHHDFNGGIRSGVSATPSFYFNGEKHDDSSTYESLSGEIRKLLGGYQTSAFF